MIRLNNVPREHHELTYACIKFMDLRDIRAPCRDKTINSRTKRRPRMKLNTSRTQFLGKIGVKIYEQFIAV